jgi:hypothetical protein
MSESGPEADMNQERLAACTAALNPQMHPARRVRRPDPEVRLDLTVIPGGHHLLKLWSQLEHFADGEIGC